MRPIEAIRSATLHTAMLLGVTESLGTIDVGKLADIVATPGNPVRGYRREDQGLLSHERRRGLQEALSRRLAEFALIRFDAAL